MKRSSDGGRRRSILSVLLDWPDYFRLSTRFVLATWDATGPTERGKHDYGDLSEATASAPTTGWNRKALISTVTIVVIATSAQD